MKESVARVAKYAAAELISPADYDASRTSIIDKPLRCRCDARSRIDKIFVQWRPTNNLKATGASAESRTTHIAPTTANETCPDHRTGQQITSTCA